MEYFEIIQRTIIKNIRFNRTDNEELLPEIYSYVPENAKYPFIRLSDFSSFLVQHADQTFTQCKVALEVFSNHKNNLDCASIMTKLQYILQSLSFFSNKYEFSNPKIATSSIKQLHTSIWHGEILLSVYVLENSV